MACERNVVRRQAFSPRRKYLDVGNLEEDSMKLYLRYAVVGAVVGVIGSAAAHAQTVITRDVIDGPPIVVGPSDTVITREVVPEDTIVTAPTRVIEERDVVTAPPRRIVRHRTVRHISGHVRHPVHLTTTQRRAIYRTVVHERPPVVVGQTIAPVEVDYSVGSILPEAVPVYAFPEDVVDDIPVVSSYDYALVNDRVLLVDPATHVVVSEVYR
jgi:hypothetical protein